VEHQNNDLHERAVARAAVATQFARHALPDAADEEMTLDQAAIKLGDAGYEVIINSQGLLIAAQWLHYNYLRVVIAEDHQSQVVTHSLVGPQGGITKEERYETGVERGGRFEPYTFRQAVLRGVALARYLHLVGQQPAVIANEAAATVEATTELVLAESAVPA
jgi:hypothetical protein